MVLPYDRERLRRISSKSGLTLAGSAAVLISLVFVTVAFCTPYWLISDGVDPSRKFRRLGLWEVCFEEFYDQHYRYLRPYRYDYNFQGCRWIFDREYRLIRPFLEPPFFVAVQVFFTLGFTLLLLACIVLLSMHLCLPPERGIQVLKAATSLLLGSAVMNTVAIIVFGAMGDGRDWIPDPDHNYLSWSYALAVVGSFCEFVAAILLWMDARSLEKRIYEDESAYPMGQPQPARA